MLKNKKNAYKGGFYVQLEEQQGNCFNLRIELSEIPQFLKKESPKLVRELEKRYPYRGIRPTKLLSGFKQLERTEQMRVLGWVYGASLRFAKEVSFYKAIDYLSLSTLKVLEKTSDFETQNSSILENMSYEEGYTTAFKG